MKIQYTSFRKAITTFFCGVGLLSLSSVGFAADSVTSSKHEAYPEYPPVNYNSGAASPDIIKKGEYLVQAGDCLACHTNTKEGGKPFAGGLPVVTPFGTMYTMNITPDKETGIGNWTDEDFIDALRHGKNPDGANYFPAFPYPYFNKISDEDVKAIRAYFMSIPAVNEPNKPLEMPWPFNWRIMQYGWKLLFFYPYAGEFEPDPKKSDEVNRGAFLVEGLGHCSLCHSPLNLLGAPKRKYILAGGFIEGFYAPNITSYNLDKASEDEIVDVFIEEDLLYDRGKVKGPMLEVDHDSLQYLTLKDLTAIAAYLKQVPPRVVKQKTISGADAGKKIYQDYCESCHGSGAGGAPKVGDSADWGPKIALGMKTLYKNAIDGIGSMPPKGTCSSCTDAQIKQTVGYMVAMSEGKEADADAKPAPATHAPALPAGTGKQVYEEACSVCHADGKVGAPKVGDVAVWQPLIQQNMDILFEHALNGYHSKNSKFAMPPKGGCLGCSDAEVEAAVKYMVDQSSDNGNYSLW